MNSTRPWREQYDRMKRWHSRLKEATSLDERHIDDFYAFFTCCFHLRDWLKADISVEHNIKSEAKILINTHVNLRLCADIANSSKHLVISRSVRYDADARVERLFQDFDAEEYDPAKDMIIVPTKEGAWPGLHLARKCVAAWEVFLRNKGLL